jgi:hypothetical protein
MKSVFGFGLMIWARNVKFGMEVGCKHAAAAATTTTHVTVVIHNWKQ